MEKTENEYCYSVSGTREALEAFERFCSERYFHEIESKICAFCSSKYEIYNQETAPTL